MAAMSQSQLALKIKEAYRYEKFDEAIRLEKELAALQNSTI